MPAPLQTADAVAEEIVGVLGAGPLRVECAERGAICYTVRSRSLELRSIVLNRAALGRLMTAANGAVKIEYLKRDLLRVAIDQIEYRYPHRTCRIHFRPT
ncbi:MAG TPA: hypothetical protein VGK04_08870 [Thermoanaerobaculia bacterium]|jgi:hypothetical protein